jgi:hypothetical protein
MNQLAISTRIASQGLPRDMTTDLITASASSSQAPTAAVDKGL